MGGRLEEKRDLNNELVQLLQATPRKHDDTAEIIKIIRNKTFDHDKFSIYLRKQTMAIAISCLEAAEELSKDSKSKANFELLQATILDALEYLKTKVSATHETKYKPDTIPLRDHEKKILHRQKRLKTAEINRSIEQRRQAELKENKTTILERRQTVYQDANDKLKPRIAAARAARAAKNLSLLLNDTEEEFKLFDEKPQKVEIVNRNQELHIGLSSKAALELECQEALLKLNSLLFDKKYDSQDSLRNKISSEYTDAFEQLKETQSFAVMTHLAVKMNLLIGKLSEKEELSQGDYHTAVDDCCGVALEALKLAESPIKIDDVPLQHAILERDIAGGVVTHSAAKESDDLREKLKSSGDYANMSRLTTAAFKAVHVVKNPSDDKARVALGRAADQLSDRGNKLKRCLAGLCLFAALISLVSIPFTAGASSIFLFGALKACMAVEAAAALTVVGAGLATAVTTAVTYKLTKKYVSFHEEGSKRIGASQAFFNLNKEAKNRQNEPMKIVDEKKVDEKRGVSQSQRLKHSPN